MLLYKFCPGIRFILVIMIEDGVDRELSDTRLVQPQQTEIFDHVLYYLEHRSKMNSSRADIAILTVNLIVNVDRGSLFIPTRWNRRSGRLKPKA